MPKLRCSDAANGNGPFRLHAAVDVRIQPGAQFQSGGRPLRRLLEPHQRQVSGLAAGGFWPGEGESRVMFRQPRICMKPRASSRFGWSTVYVLRSEGSMPAVGTVLRNRSVKGHVPCPILLLKTRTPRTV